MKVTKVITTNFEFLHTKIVAEWHRKNNEDLQINWSAKGIGFSELTFYRKPGEKIWKCYSEMMSKSFVQQAIQYLLKSLPKPRKHSNRRWNKRRFNMPVVLQNVCDNMEIID